MAGFYERRIFPWLNDALARSPEIAQLRTEALSRARGRVLEIGFGTGANLPYYPGSVDSILAIEPNSGMRDRATSAIGTSRIPIDVRLTSAEELAIPDKSVDTAVSTLTLCSVADPDRVLAELRRVLRDDGVLILMEHGLSPDERVRRWQRRLNRLQNVLACGCNLNRDIPATISRAGFHAEDLRSFYVKNVPRTHGWFTVGAAQQR